MASRIDARAFAVYNQSMKCSDELRKQRSENAKRLWNDPEYRRKAVEARVGKPLPKSDEHRKKLSEAMKSKWQDEAYRKEQLPKVLSAMSEAHPGPNVSDSTRRKLSESAKRQWENPSVRRRMSEAISKGRKGVIPSFRPPTTGEAKQKMSIRQKASWSKNYEHRVKSVRRNVVLARSVRGNNSEATKALISEKANHRYADPLFCQKFKLARREMYSRPSYLAHQSEARKRLWESSDTYKERVLAGLAREGGSSLEDALAPILDEFDTGYVRQYVIGRAIADFFYPHRQLVIESDGEYWHTKPEVERRDKRRDSWLRSQGYRVLRLTESQIKTDPRAILALYLRS